MAKGKGNKLPIVTALLLLGGGVGLAVMSTAERNHAPLSLIANPDARHVADLGWKFMEDIQFKDFKSAAELSSPADRDKANIPHLIERLFLVKPEQLEIDKIELLEAKLDSTGQRARTKMGTTVKLLDINQERNMEIMLYWKKAEDGQWYMDLQSSLHDDGQ